MLRIRDIVHEQAKDSVKLHCADCAGHILGICNVIEATDLPALLAESGYIRLPAGRVFLQEGVPAHDFYVVATGRVKIFNLLPDGRRQITAFIEPGGFIGLAATNYYAFSAQVLEDAILCRFSQQAMRRLSVRFPQLAQRLCEEAARELVRLQARLLLLGRKTARERVAAFLLERVEAGLISRKDGDLKKGSKNTGGDKFSPIHEMYLPMSRGDVADYLGLTIETVSRILSRFRQERLIEMHDIAYVLLLNRAKLAEIARG